MTKQVKRRKAREWYLALNSEGWAWDVFASRKLAAEMFTFVNGGKAKIVKVREVMPKKRGERK